MANSLQAIKRTRQALKRAQRNTQLRSKMRTYLKKAYQATASGQKDIEAAKQVFKETVSVLDTLTNKGLIHKNKAARHKARINQRIKGLMAT